MIIKTRRLVLRSPVNDIAERQVIASFLNDKEVTKFSEQRHYVHTAKTQKAYISHLKPPSLYLIIEHDGAIIGSLSARVDKNNGVANMGILIGGKERWGQGFGGEAWGAFAYHLLREAGIRKIEAGCMASNLAMRSICMASGMDLEGRSLGHFMLNGKPEDAVYYGKLA